MASTRLAVDRPERGQRGDLEGGQDRVGVQLHVEGRGGLAQLGGEGQGPAEAAGRRRPAGSAGALVSSQSLTSARGYGSSSSQRSMRMRRVPTAASAERPSGKRSTCTILATVPTSVRTSPPPTSLPRSMRTTPNSPSPASQSSTSARYRGSNTCSGQDERREEHRAEREHRQGRASSAAAGRGPTWSRFGRCGYAARARPTSIRTASPSGVMTSSLTRREKVRSSPSGTSTTPERPRASLSEPVLARRRPSAGVPLNVAASVPVSPATARPWISGGAGPGHRPGPRGAGRRWPGWRRPGPSRRRRRCPARS